MSCLEDIIQVLQNDPAKASVIRQMLNMNSSSPRSPRKILKETSTQNVLSPTPDKVRPVPSTSTASSTLMSPPPLEQILKGVVAFVDVKRNNEDKSESIRVLMQCMGAAVVDRLTHKVTHVIFKDGSQALYDKARLMGKPVMSVLWLEAIRKNRARVEEKKFYYKSQANTENDILQCTQWQKDFNAMVRDERLKSKMSQPPDQTSDGEDAHILTDDDDMEYTSDESACAIVNGSPGRSKRSDSEATKSGLESMANRTRSSVAMASLRLSESDRTKSGLGVTKNSSRTSLETSRASTNKKKNVTPSSSPTTNAKKRKLYNPLDPIVPMRTDSDDERERQERRAFLRSKAKNLLSSQPTPIASQEPMSKNPRKGSQSKKPTPKTKKQSQPAKSPAEPSPKAQNQSQPAKSPAEPSPKAQNQSQPAKSPARKEPSPKAQNQSQPLTNGTEPPEREGPSTNTRSRSSTQMESEQPTPSKPSSSGAAALNESARCNLDLLHLLRIKTNALNKEMKNKEGAKNKSDVINDSDQDEQQDLLAWLKFGENRGRESDTETSSEDEAASPVRSTRRNQRSTMEFQVNTAAPSKRFLAVKRRCGGIVVTKFHRSEWREFQRIVETLGKFTIETNVTDHTTHLIVGEEKRTVNLLKAIVRGCWILRKDYLTRSATAGRWLDEEAFELDHLSPAIKTGRIQRQAFGRKYSLDLFSETDLIYIAKKCDPKFADLKDIVLAARGHVTMLKNRAKIIVGKYVEGCNATCVTPFWILDSVMRNKVQPLEKYILSRSKSPEV